MDNTPNSIASAYPSVSQEKGVIMQGNQGKPYDILYARLSSEDAGDGRSLSIDNQETQLRKRAEELGLDNPLFLYDDGISGTKNNRPQFQEALRLVEMRQVRSFMVTDLSRLYRNQAYANELLEEIFPSLNVRLISIAESYDTLTNGPSNEDMAMFSNLFNEYHPRMTSRKINALIHTKCENGVRIASIPPYGYQKDPEDKNKIVPDPEAAEMVKEIYRLCVAGLGPTQIAKQLEARKILVPAEYAWRKFGRDHSHRNPDRPYAWSDGTVARILENPDYIGTQVNQKTHKVSYKSDKVIRVPKEEQYRFENAHEPIIDREVWEIVQTIRENRRRPTKMGEMDVLAGMVFCADCGHVLHLCRCGSWNENQYTFVCGTYHSHNEECTPHTIKVLHLRQLTLAAIQDVCQWATEDREGFLEHIFRKRESQAKKELTAKKRALERLQKRLKELETYTMTAFEKLASGVLTDEVFQTVTQSYAQERNECNAQIEQLTEELERESSDVDNANQFLAVVDRYLNPQELTHELVHEFVERIVVHERSEPSKKKYYTQAVDIYFNYIGKLA